MRVLLFVLGMFCIQCATMRSENPTSGDSALHNPSGNVRLSAISVGGVGGVSYCAVLEEGGKRTILTPRGSLTEKQLRKAVRYSSKWRYWFWFPHAKAVQEGEKEETIMQMRLAGDYIFLTTEEGIRQQRVAAMRDTTGEDELELKTRKIKIIADRIRNTQPESHNLGVCKNIN